jgi:hypothetical protein
MIFGNLHLAVLSKIQFCLQLSRCHKSVRFQIKEKKKNYSMLDPVCHISEHEDIEDRLRCRDPGVWARHGDYSAEG